MPVCKKCGYKAKTYTALNEHMQRAKIAHQLIHASISVNLHRRRKHKKELHGTIRVGEKEYSV